MRSPPPDCPFCAGLTCWPHGRFAATSGDAQSAAVGNSSSAVAPPAEAPPPPPLRIAVGLCALVYMAVRGVYKTRVDKNTAGDQVSELVESTPHLIVRHCVRVSAVSLHAAPPLPPCDPS